MEKRLTGMLGETAAAKYYRKNGYEILAANYRTRQGELDLVVKKNNLIVVAEVKARSKNSIAQAKEFVTHQKQQRIILAAKSYLAANGLTESNIRFDVIEVNIDNNVIIDLNCIENAFDAF